MANFIKGILIGIALVIPGLSGSVFAVVTGLYDKIIFSVNNIRTEFKKSVLFLLPIVIGIVIGILISTKAVLYLCISFPVFSYIFFIGLVVGSIPFILKKLPNARINIKNIGFFLIAMAFILVLSSLKGSKGTEYISIDKIDGINDILTLLFAGVFSCSLMTIPGVSGSVLLMAINQYGTVYNAVSKVADALKNFLKGDFGALFENMQSILVIIPFLIGALVGIVVIAKLLGFVLKKYQEALYVCVLGLMTGAIIILFNEGVLENLSGFSFSILNSIICLALLVLGYLSSAFFDPQ